MTTENPIQPQTQSEPQAPALRSGDLFGELEYIAASPAKEYGGFHPRVVAAAKGAIAEITRLQNNYACAVENEAAFLDVMREVKRWQADGRNGHCLVIRGKLLERLEAISSPNSD